ncbi:hypothetical protein ACFU2J_35885 [Streptomyces sp. NPDC057387]
MSTLALSVLLIGIAVGLVAIGGLGYLVYSRPALSACFRSRDLRSFGP